MSLPSKNPLPSFGLTQAAINALITTAIANKQDKVANVSDTEIGYLDGVTSAIQTQINALISNLIRLSPVVTLGAISETIEWIGDTTFDFTTYEECYFIANLKLNNVISELTSILDGVVINYYWQRNIQTSTSNTITEGNNDTKIDFNSGLNLGFDSQFIIIGKIWKTINGSLLFDFSYIGTEGFVLLKGASSATKLDKISFKAFRVGFPFPDAGSKYFEINSRLRVYGVKK